MLGVWLLVIVFAIIAEIATQVQLVSVWAVFGGVAALVAYLCGAPLYAQIIIFFAVTFALLALTRPLVRKMTAKIKNTPTNADMNIGKTGKVTKIVDASDGTFRVHLGGDDWSAKMSDSTMPELGAEVRVERIEGVKLIVTPV